MSSKIESRERKILKRSARPITFPSHGLVSESGEKKKPHHKGPLVILAREPFLKNGTEGTNKVTP